MYLQQLQQVEAEPRAAPEACLGVIHMATPAGDRYSFVHQHEQMWLREQRYVEDMANYGPNVLNWTKFDADWARENPPERFSAQATAELGGYFKGVTPADMVHYPYYPKSQTEFDALPAGVPVWWHGKGGWTQSISRSS